MRINRIIITVVLTGLMAALAAAAWGPARAEAAAIAPGALADVDLSEGERSYAFTPASGSVYDVCLRERSPPRFSSFSREEPE